MSVDYVSLQLVTSNMVCWPTTYAPSLFFSFWVRTISHGYIMFYNTWYGFYSPIFALEYFMGWALNCTNLGFRGSVAISSFTHFHDTPPLICLGHSEPALTSAP